MSSDALAVLIGAGFGAVTTLLVGLVGRIWQSRDAQAQARRDYVVATTNRLQRIVKAKSKDDLAALNHEMFNTAALGIYIPRKEDSVHLWYSLRDVEILQLALDSRREDGQRQAEVFSRSIDAMSELRAWARRERSRSHRWFDNELRTTDRELLKAVRAAAERAEGGRSGDSI